MKTKSLRKEDVVHDWYVADATDQVLGRFASKIADKLRGKDKATYTPHVDGGDFVIVLNARKIKVTGNKAHNKSYFSHSLYPGGLKIKSFKQMQTNKPTEIIRLAVKGMLPKNKLSNVIIKKLKIYSGSEHPHDSQKPKKWKI